jgi:5-formyltetrahydrofolate cyclo-ligase
MIKTQLRKAYLERRAALSAQEVQEASRGIAELFFDEVPLAGVRSVHTFIRIPKFNEIDTSLIYHRIWREYPSIQMSAPRLSGSDGIESVNFDLAAETAESDWGIHEPAGDILTPPEDIDVVIVPLLCFDLRGYRVGYGKGYYDRFLAKCRSDCLKVGVSCFPPVPSIEDVDRYDVKLDLCIMPEKCLRFG